MRHLDNVKLSALAPSSDDVKAAKELRDSADNKKLRSVKTGFDAYLKKNPDEAINSADTEIKEKLLLNFMVLQLRAKGG